MDSNFTKLMPFIIDIEVGKFPNGGYTNHPDDPGGETKYGISDARDGLKDSLMEKKIPIKDLTLQQAYQEYYEDYYVPSGASELEFPLAACVFDTAVNMGLGKAKRFLKECEGSWKKYLELRAINYSVLVDKNPSLSVFKKGWLNRINHLKTFILLNLTSE